MDDGLVWQTIFSVGSVLAYAALAALLVWHTLHRFEIVAGRAQRASIPPPSSLKLPDPQKGTPATTQPEVAGCTCLIPRVYLSCPTFFRASKLSHSRQSILERECEKADE